jgi:SAM-dependent methyltransferase
MSQKLPGGKDLGHYVIRGGIEGRERLRIIGRVLHATTSALFDRVGLADGQICLDVGCGGGDVTSEIARRVAPRGRVVGLDLDEAKIALARGEAAERGLRNLEYRVGDIRQDAPEPSYDVVYARFLLTHLPDPAGAVETFRRFLKPGGLAVLEDIDYGGYFVYPDSPAFQRYHELYCAAVRRRGGDPDIGRRLPSLLKEGGFEAVEISVVQVMAMQGEAKLVNALTVENIADAVVAEGLASRDEIARLVRDLLDYAADPCTLAGTPRIVQAWGRRPS